MNKEYAERLDDALGGKYRIERELGEGGMATVYLADDLRHERKVAVKVLKPELAAAVGAERFLAEIKTTANLQHLHIVPLYDSGESDGFAYFVMPYIEGETLRDRLQREEPFTVDEAVAIAADIAEALHAAHEQGVIHRDIKPANILLSRGRPLVADFGIALTMNAAEEGRMTGTGVSFGTPRYMSPEQASEDYEVGAQSDIYSLACVLYAMLTGEPPHVGSTVQALLAKKLTKTPTPLKSIRPDVPDHVDRAVARALQITPADRHETAEEFAQEIRPPGWTLGGGSVRLEPAIGDWAPPKVVLGRRHRLVGRDEELETLRGHLDRTLDGQGSFVLIAGEPGVGKTRLAEEIMHEALDRGAMVVIGHCTEMDSASPYTPIVEQLDYAARFVKGETFREILGDSASEIARLLPRLRTMFPDIPPAPVLPPDVQRRNLFQNYREFVERASKRAPIVALYDDLHWSDDATLLLLEQMAPDLARLPILYIGTHRDVEQDVGRPWARAMGTLTRQRLADRIALQPMPEDEVANLLAELGSSPPPSRIVHAVFKGTEGNPFFVEEVFHHLVDEDRLFDDAGEWRSDLSDAELDVPEGVRIVIGHRLERLEKETLAMLGPAALIGRRFDLQLLEALEVLDPDALLDALEEAERAGLIHSDSSVRSPMYGFTHELIRQTLLQNISSARRQRRHLQIAEAIKQTYPDALDRRAADIAYHMFEAGSAADVDETRSFCIMAARRALDGAAFEEALAHIERAYSVEERDPAPEQTLLLERARAEALWGTGMSEWPNAVATWLRALEIAESLQDGPAIIGICIQVNFGLLALDDHQTARTTAQKGLAVLGDARIAERSLLLAKYGLAAAFTDFHVAREALDAAEEIAHDIGDSLTLGRVLGDRTGYLISWGRPREAIEAGLRSLDLLDVSVDPMTWIITAAHVLLGLHVSGLEEGMAERAEELRRHSDRFGNLYGQTFAVRAQMDIRLHTAGDWKAYEELAVEAAELHGRFPSVAGRGQLFFALCALNRREAAKAYEMVCEGAARTSTLGAWSPTWLGTLFWHAVRAGAPDIEDRAQTVLATLPDPDKPMFIGWYDGIMASVEAFARWGRVEDAAALLPLMSAVVERGWKTGGGGLLSHTCAGIAAAAAGDWEAAEGHFDDADEFCGSRIVIFPARNLYWRAWTRLRRGEPGDAEEAKALLEDARARFQGHGMLLDVDDVDALLAEIP